MEQPFFSSELSLHITEQTLKMTESNSGFSHFTI